MTGVYRLEALTVRFGPKTAIDSISCTLQDGQMVAIVGPNGAGKSTLISILAGVRTGYRGSCFLLDREIRSWNRRLLARTVAYVPQAVHVELPFTAEEVVLMGRTPHADGLFDSPEDWQAVEEAIRILDIEPFRKQDFRTLSGGEQQRVLLAAALAQQTPVLLLDEPTTFLDLSHQIAIYGILSEQARNGALIVAVTHDLNLAAAYADRVLVLDSGRLVADGPPAEILNRQLIREVFDVEVTITYTQNGSPRIIYAI